MPSGTQQVGLGRVLGCLMLSAEGPRSMGGCRLCCSARLGGLPLLCCPFPQTAGESSGWCHLQNIWEAENWMCFYICRMWLLPEGLQFRMPVSLQLGIKKVIAKQKSVLLRKDCTSSCSSLAVGKNSLFWGRVKYSLIFSMKTIVILQKVSQFPGISSAQYALGIIFVKLALTWK